MEKHCLQCGKTYTAAHAAQKYCSPLCYFRHAKEEMKQLARSPSR